MSYRLVIPARLSSERLPEKPLADVAGKPLVVRVLERGLKSDAEEVLVAVDHARIAEAVTAAGGDAVLTSAHHRSGTDRLAEVARVRGWSDDTVVVNLQGDEPLGPASVLDALAEDLAAHPECGLATMATAASAAEVFNPNVVKVVMRDDGRALYFSRAPIPFARGSFDRDDRSLPEGVPYLRHLGLYAYRVRTLKLLADAPPAAAERAESLEQLRALALGVDIHVRVLDEAPPHGVDVPADLERVREAFREAEA